MLEPLEKAILVATDRLTRGKFDSTDSNAIAAELRAEGHELPPKIPYERLFLQLKDRGYLVQATTRTGGDGVIFVELTEQGREVARGESDPAEEIWSDARRLFGSERFAKGYPGAYAPWADAASRLLGDQPETQLAQIGFNCRDAVQAFADELQAHYPPTEPDPEVTHTKNRLRGVIETYKARIGERRTAVLDSMLTLWNADVDLIQRQTHANERAGNPLTVNDGRRVVSLTMFLMIEFAEIFDEMDDGPSPATLGSE